MLDEERDWRGCEVVDESEFRRRVTDALGDLGQRPRAMARGAVHQAPRATRPLPGDLPRTFHVELRVARRQWPMSDPRRLRLEMIAEGDLPPSAYEAGAL